MTVVPESIGHMHPFVTWLFREYKKPELRGHPLWLLSVEIEAVWLLNFPKKGDYLDLAFWLSNHGACRKCLKSFKDAWDQYSNDI